MAKVLFTSNLSRHVSCPTGHFAGDRVADVLQQVFASEPALRGYVIDEQGRLRQHVVIFVDGRPLQDRLRLSDAVGRQSEVCVMQALSGG